MSAAWTKLSFDFASLPPLSSPRRELGLAGVALGIVHLGAGQGYTFTHHHEAQEEVYAVLEGAGEILLDGVREPLERGDVVRVSAPVRRALRAGADTPLLVLCAGAVPAGWPRDANARYLIDDGVPHYDDLPPWCADDPAARAKNAELEARSQRAERRRRGAADLG